MGCGNSKAVPVLNQSSSSTSSDSSSGTVPEQTRCLLKSSFFDNVATIKSQARELKYNTVEHYLIAIIKCLSELVIELDSIPDSPELFKKLKTRFSDRFDTSMTSLGLFKSKESIGKTIFSSMFVSISPDTIQELQNSLKIFMYLIILLIRILDPKLNEYVSGQTSQTLQPSKVETANRFTKIKIKLLNELDNIFNTIYNDENKAQFIANFDKVLNIRKSKKLKNYNLDLNKNKHNVINKLIEKIKDTEVMDEHTESICIIFKFTSYINTIIVLSYYRLI